jgi:predicted transglutaminase-like cysteine proteinase
MVIGISIKQCALGALFSLLLLPGLVLASDSFIPTYQEIVLDKANVKLLKSKWTAIVRRSEIELEKLEQGRFKTFFSYVRSLDPEEQVLLVNIWVNNRVKFASEMGGLDYWQSAGESLISGHGDCEDFAIAKYLLLRHLGHDVSDMLLVVSATRKAEYHMALYVRTDVDVLALDNNLKTAQNSLSHATRYIPIYGFRESIKYLYLYKRPKELGEDISLQGHDYLLPTAARLMEDSLKAGFH